MSSMSEAVEEEEEEEEERTTGPEEGKKVKVKVGYVYDAVMEKHRIVDDDHPECPERTRTIDATMTRYGLKEACVALTPRRATDEEILTSHSKEYASLLASSADRRGRYLSRLEARWENDVYMCGDTYTAACTALGCTVEAARAVASGRCRHALACVRPPGHHACQGKAMGFCFLNNVAVAAKLAAKGVLDGRRRTVLIVDFDVHHGNGTQNLTYDDPDVLYFSIHRGFFYPGTGFPREVGSGTAKGLNVNVAFPDAGNGGPEYARAWVDVLLPIARAFSPSLILISAGFDAAKGDPLGESTLEPQHYHALVRPLADLAPSVLVLEGGYNCEIIGHCFAACAAAFFNRPWVFSPSSSSSSSGESSTATPSTTAAGSKSPSVLATTQPQNETLDLNDLAVNCSKSAARAVEATLAHHVRYWPTLADRHAGDPLVDQMTGLSLVGVDAVAVAVESPQQAAKTTASGGGPRSGGHHPATPQPKTGSPDAQTHPYPATV